MLATAATGEATVAAVEPVCAAREQPAKRAHAVRALRAALDRVPPDRAGLVDHRRAVAWLAMLGALDDAFDVANRALDRFAEFGMIGFQCGVLWMPELQAFRRDPRFAPLTERLRLPRYWRQSGAPDGYRLSGHRLVEEPR
jgi:hypothetical protein